MINLLPPSRKQAVHYARLNSFLVNWIVGILVAVLGLLLISGGGLFYIQQDRKSHEQSITNAEAALKKQKEEETLTRVDSISNRLSLVVNVLSKEVQFSKLLPHVGSIMPDGTVLNDLSLTRDEQNGIELSIGAIDHTTASQALVNLQAADSLLFAGADINSVSCDGDPAETQYVCTASIRVLLVKDNPFLMLNEEGKND